MKIKKPTKYLTNKSMLAQLALSHQQNQITEDLGKMFLLLTTKYAMKPNFRGYSYKDEMIADAVEHLVLKWTKFDYTKSDNPFAYFTSCIHNSFLKVLNREKRVQKMRDEMLVDAGVAPSFSYQTYEE